MELIVLIYSFDGNGQVLIGVFENQEDVDDAIEHLVRTEDAKRIRFIERKVEVGVIGEQFI